jgi:hypothetical protein
MDKKISVSSIADVATKGGIAGVISYLLSTWNIDPALNIVILPVALYALNELSTKVGDPNIANFFAKQSKVVEATIKETVAQAIPTAKPLSELTKPAPKKQVAKKPAAKKAKKK